MSLPPIYGLATATGIPDSANTTYSVIRLEKHLIEMEGKTAGVRIRKTYVLPDEACSTPYTFEYTVNVDENPSELYLSTGIPEVEIVSGSSSPTLKYRSINAKQKASIEQISLPKGSTSLTNIRPEWVSNSNGFFAVLIDPQTEMGAGFTASQVPGTAAPTRLAQIDPDQNRFPVEKYPGYDLKVPSASRKGPISFASLQDLSHPTCSMPMTPLSTKATKACRASMDGSRSSQSRLPSFCFS